MAEHNNKLKVTQLTISEVKKKIYDNDIQDVYVLSNDTLDLHAIKDCRLESIRSYMLRGSAFLTLEVENNDRTAE
nr:MAG TPA: hypothetical protein [Caudoviricetes sp.]